MYLFTEFNLSSLPALKLGPKSILMRYIFLFIFYSQLSYSQTLEGVSQLRPPQVCLDPTNCESLSELSENWNNIQDVVLDERIFDVSSEDLIGLALFGDRLGRDRFDYNEDLRCHFTELLRSLRIEEENEFSLDLDAFLRYLSLRIQEEGSQEPEADDISPSFTDENSIDIGVLSTSAFIRSEGRIFVLGLDSRSVGLNFDTLLGGNQNSNTLEVGFNFYVPRSGNLPLVSRQRVRGQSVSIALNLGDGELENHRLQLRVGRRCNHRIQGQCDNYAILVFDRHVGKLRQILRQSRIDSAGIEQ